MGRHKKSRSNRKQTRDAPEVRDGDPFTSHGTDVDLPYNVETSERLGRYLTAKRDLKAGEIIMTDKVIVIGPCQESKPMCIGCYKDIDLNDEESYKRCTKCSWPLCSSLCPGSHLTPFSDEKNVFHTLEECNFLSESLVKNVSADTLKTCFYAVTPLRLLMVKRFDPELWKIVEGMEAHTEIRRLNPGLWKLNEEMAVDKIRNLFGLSEFTPEEIHFACGVLEVNAFELIPSEQPLRAIYPNACLFSHDCVPNTNRSTGEGFSLIVRTITSCPKNSLLTISYTYTLQSTMNRRKHLQETKFFSCSCRRCSDVTEFGLYCSAIKCPLCKTGYVLPKDPLDTNSVWECKSRKCSGHSSPASVISIMTGRIWNELDNINGNDIDGYENFLRKHSGVLSENHYLCLSALHSLFQLYGKTEGYLIDEMTENDLERKIYICRKLLKIFDKLEPGLSKQRALLLYELQAPIMILLRRRFDQQTVTKKELKQKMREVNRCLEETYQILGTEWSGTPEGEVAAAAKDALQSMKNWEGVIELL